MEKDVTGKRLDLYYQKYYKNVTDILIFYFSK